MNASVIYARRPQVWDHDPVTKEGLTIRDYLDSKGIGEFEVATLCQYNGEAKGRAEWPLTVIEHGSVLTFTTLPAGGGQDGGSNPLAVIAMIVVMIVAAYVAGPAAAFLFGKAAAGSAAVVGAVGTVITTSGALLVNALLPPEGPRDQDVPSPTYSLQSPGNQSRLGQPRVVGYGRMLVTPNFAEQPYTVFEGQNAEEPRGDPSDSIAAQWLNVLLDIGEGLYDIEDVRFGLTSVEGFEDVEWEKYDPGEAIELIPQLVVTNPDVQSLSLLGPNETGWQGQTLPATKTSFYTADSGTQDIGGGIGELVDSSETFDASLIGKQVWIGGAEEPVDWGPDNDDADLFKNVTTGHKADRLAHPRLLRTIVDVPNSTTLRVRPAWDATYGPHDASHRNYHIRQDYGAPHVVNASGTEINKIGIDVMGPPSVRTSEKGEKTRIGIGLRFEKRRIDDNGDPVSGADGDWSLLGKEWREWHISPTGGFSSGGESTIGLLKGWKNQPGVVRSRRSSVAIWGPGQTINPIALSFLYKVPKGRYEVRASRQTYFRNSIRHSNSIAWSGLKGYIRNPNRTYPTTTLAIHAKGSAAVNSNSIRDVRVLWRRKVRTWGDAANDDLGTFALGTQENSSILSVMHTAHHLAVGQTVTISGAPSIGGIPANDINKAHTITAILTVNSYQVDTGTVATGSVAGGNSVHVDATAGWQTETHTASPVWALLDSATAAYGGGRPDSKLDLVGLRALADTATTRGDEFNGLFDSRRRQWAAYNVIMRTLRCKCIKPDGVLTAIRDEPQTIRQAVFSPRNIKRGTIRVSYNFLKPDSPDSVAVGFYNRDKWSPDVTPPHGVVGGTTDRPATVPIFGITDREHATREALYMAADNRYRRIRANWRTELQGHIPSFMGMLSLSYPWTGWGNGGDVVGYDSGLARITTSEPLTWAASGDHYVAFERKRGQMDGPYLVTKVAGTDNQLDLPGALSGWAPTTIPDKRERTKYVFGPAGAWNRNMIVTAAVPRSIHAVEMHCVNEDSRVHSADQATYVPPLPEDDREVIPDAPVVAQVHAYEFGDQANRRLHVSWTPAPGADYYVVEQANGGPNGRRVNVAAGAIQGGTVDDLDTIRGFAATKSFAIINPLGTTISVAEVVVQEAAHGMETGDWIFIDGSPALGSIPASEINGAHSVTKIDANQVKFTTTTAADISRFHEVPDAVFGIGTGMTGTVLRAPEAGDTYMYYEHLTDPELVRLEVFVSMDGDGWGTAFYDSTISASQSLMGETQQTFLEGPVVRDEEGGALGSVRVRGVGKLFGPWNMVAVSGGDEDSFGIPFDPTTGLAYDLGDTTIGVGQTLTLFAWLHDGATSVSMGTLPVNAFPMAVYYNTEEAFDGTGNEFDVGTTGDQDLCAGIIPCGVTGKGEIRKGDALAGIGLLDRITTAAGEEIFAKYTGSGASTGRVGVFLAYQVLPDPPA